MEVINIETLKKSKHFRENTRWDVTPRIFLKPKSASGETIDTSHGYMLYLDKVDDMPVMVIMQLSPMMSKTVGYVRGIPEALLQEAIKSTSSESISGMYPLGEKLESWLKKEFGL